MKKELYLIRNIIGLSSLFLIGSCRSTDTENTLSGSGSSAVSFNLLGTEFAESGNLSGQASSGKADILNSADKIQRHSILVTPSSVVTAELSPSADASKVPTQASLGLNPVTAAPGNPITSGTKFRVIAYRSNGSYHTHQDYTVGQTATPMMLDGGAAYNIVIYSYGIASLPAISSGEQNNISSATVNYDNTNRDFMYQKIPFTPNATNSTLNITLRHKVAQITTIINSTGVGSMSSITGAVLTPHYSNGSFSLNTGTMSGRSTTTSGATLNFPSSGFPGTIQTASPVFVNADTAGNATGNFSAQITLAGVTKNISFPNSFKITPENKSNLTISLKKCGAYIGANTNPANYKEFMCHNLGADTSADAFTPAATIHGAKYQWGAQTNETGRYISQANDQSNSGIIFGWNGVAKANGSWSDTSKTANDPCPAGYRVPTTSQLQAVINNNNIERVGTWIDGNYTSAIYFRNPSNIRTLMLPAAGNRDIAGGVLNGRGFSNNYWTSSEAGITASYLYFGGTSIFMSSGNRTYGFSVRCISQ
ncbi:FISUMP domain-containing protein [Elizabethkingia occulta]|uniref:Uncharacterized protein n=1 Tax=Elizabethkingia occulta TaxID=1867263 RepID=A0A1T3MXA8_9FLAO|nr:FISUMP domain-containing protein [Elizabethkingia occulta]OPB92510.1 hypothetical protein BB020_07845 [Elizabethkingia occulta]OPC68981.1 hypothetical protein BAZ10_00095 [Elizabethkingia occulta]